MSKFFAPLALIVSLLSLFLYVLMRRSLGDFQQKLHERINKRRDEILELQRGPAPGGSAQPSVQLTPELRQQIEQLVQERVAEELRQQKAAGSSGAAPAIGKPETKAKQAPKAESARPAEPQPAPIAEPPVENTAFANISEAPSVYTPPVTAPDSGLLAASVLPAGSPAAAARDEFDSLVPPVQLPTPERAVAPGPALRYVKVPVNGGFSEYDLTDQPQHDSIYQISLNQQNPDAATFRVNPNPAVHAYAIQSAQFSLREACRYQQPSGPVTRIITDEDGTLRRVGGAWQIEQKAAIRFE